MFPYLSGVLAFQNILESFQIKCNHLVQFRSSIKQSEKFNDRFHNGIFVIAVRNTTKLTSRSEVLGIEVSFGLRGFKVEGVQDNYSFVVICGFFLGSLTKQ